MHSRHDRQGGGRKKKTEIVEGEGKACAETDCRKGMEVKRIRGGDEGKLQREKGDRLDKVGEKGERYRKTERKE